MTTMCEMPKVVPILGPENFLLSWGSGDTRCSWSWLNRVLGFAGDDVIPTAERVAEMWIKRAHELTHHEYKDRGREYRCKCEWMMFFNDFVFGCRNGGNQILADLWNETWRDLGYFEEDGKMWRADCKPTEPTTAEYARAVSKGCMDWGSHKEDVCQPLHDGQVAQGKPDKQPVVQPTFPPRFSYFTLGPGGDAAINSI